MVRLMRSNRSGSSPVRILFVTSNGTGMGHLTRLLAMANRSSERIEPFFFSLSSAVPVVATYGYGWEYCPSHDELDVSGPEWEPLFTERLAEIIGRFEPSALVFDGVVPYDGFELARQKFPDLVYVWSRRAMWRRDAEPHWLKRSSWFDLTIEPGEIAAPADTGPTVGRADAVRVKPITLLDQDDLLDRARARSELGIDPAARAVLITLGAGSLTDLESDLDVVAKAVEHRRGWQVYATHSPLSRRGKVSRNDITALSVYPMAQYLAAFDATIIACGYNTYHEAIMSGTPTIFVPRSKMVDDQHARARFAADRGIGIAVESLSHELIDHALDQIGTPGATARMRQRCIDHYPGNGAGEAMATIEELLARRGVLR